MPEDLGEKTEQPTEKKREDARKEGRVARSQDLNSALDMLAALVTLAVVGGFLAKAMQELLISALSDPIARPEEVEPIIAWAGSQTASVMVPSMVALAVLIAGARFVQVGWLVTFKPVTPKLDRASPISGFKRIFSRRSAVKSLVNSVKLLVIAGVVGAVAWYELPTIIGLAALEIRPMIAVIGQILLTFTAVTIAAMLLLGVIDYIYQRWQHTQDLKMTRQEVRDERKTMEGDPEYKARRLSVARSIMMQRIRQSVPDADVIVTNPTHFAIALKYDPNNMDAPRVVAKGGDYLAHRIRELAAAHRVPIIERPALARALYAKVPVGHAIPAEFYEAVAEILAYVYRLEGRAA